MDVIFKYIVDSALASILSVEVIKHDKPSMSKKRGHTTSFPGEPSSFYLLLPRNKCPVAHILVPQASSRRNFRSLPSKSSSICRDRKERNAHFSEVCIQRQAASELNISSLRTQVAKVRDSTVKPASKEDSIEQPW